MPETAPTPQRKPLRRLAVSVRALMLLVLAVGLGIGWKINRAGTQKRAVARIEKAGGVVLHDYEFDGTYPYKMNPAPRGPAWLRARLGDEFFQEATKVNFYDAVTDDQVAPIADLDRLLAIEFHKTGLTDAGLAHLANLKSLREVQIDGTRITDAGLARLKPLTGLRRLDLGQEGPTIAEIQTEAVAKLFRELGPLTHTQKVGELMRRRGTAITDAGLAHVGELARLQELSLRLPGITDAGLAHVGKLTDLRTLKFINTNVNDAGLIRLKGLTALRELTITSEGVTDAGLAHLAGLTGLRSLALWHTRITDVGMTHLWGLHRLEILDLRNTVDLTDQGLSSLAGLKGLRELNLEGSMVTDAGLVHLAGLPELRELDLSSDEITDAGLAHLKGLARLRRLNLDGTKVGAEGVAALREAIPSLVVSHRRRSFLSDRTARQERAWRKWDADLKKTQEDMKKFMKEVEADGVASIPLPAPPSLPPEE